MSPGFPRAASAFVLLLGCTGGAATSGSTAPKPMVASTAKAHPPLVFSDDLEVAIERAREQGKLVFVDAWAPWCHTCLSMRHYVLGDPSLRPLAEHVVFAAIDTDRPEAAAFLDTHAMSVWPTFFVIDPADQKVYGQWPGAASVRELRGFVEDSLRVAEQARGTGAGDEVLTLLADARRAQSARDWPKATASFEAIVQKTGRGARRSEALLGWVQSLGAGKHWTACASLGPRFAAEVEGAAVPADFAGCVLSCADKLSPGPAQKEARAAAVARLQRLTRSPSPEASVDDRADAFALLADGLAALGDERGARAAREQGLAVLETAAARAPTPEVQATFDYARATAYVALGRADEAVRLLTRRVREMPESYEPPARLADVLAKIGRLPEALEAVDQAIQRAYGPRRLRYLKLKAEVFAKMGDKASQVATLREEVAGWEALAKGHANQDKLGDAQHRLDDAVAQAKEKR